MKDKEIGILLGGVSAERDISLKTGEAMFEALKAQGLALDTLSIGMSADLEAAIHSGSTKRNRVVGGIDEEGVGIDVQVVGDRKGSRVERDTVSCGVAEGCVSGDGKISGDGGVSGDVGTVGRDDELIG